MQIVGIGAESGCGDEGTVGIFPPKTLQHLVDFFIVQPEMFRQLAFGKKITKTANDDRNFWQSKLSAQSIHEAVKTLLI